MNLLEIVILHIFLVLFSMPSKPTTGAEADTERVEGCTVEYGAEDVKTTRGILLEENGPAIDSPAVEKIHSNVEPVVSRRVISSSEPKFNKRARYLPKPPSIIIPN